jgi:hypothetical protein
MIRIVGFVQGISKPHLDTGLLEVLYLQDDNSLSKKKTKAQS